MALSFFYLGVTGTTYAYTTDHYDASIRATGAGFANAAGRVGAIIGPLLVGILIQMKVPFGIIFIMFFVACFLAALNVLFLGKETRVKPNEQEEAIIKEAAQNFY
ncbi:hypothetical protein AM1BK_27840 [Neobacillus kokaensis]|uniref:Major facilitator superfamily (MFS) profile domain-containing protein n=1 Tax=Neobacillus kokaensis TaxID=2759023 RepID=A0ABQ3N5B0_9BACI|nr:hypothetical protein AM1BK_27840 [Neobacillus kokaensis]